MAAEYGVVAFIVPLIFILSGFNESWELMEVAPKLLTKQMISEKFLWGGQDIFSYLLLASYGGDDYVLMDNYNS